MAQGQLSIAPFDAGTGSLEQISAGLRHWVRWVTGRPDAVAREIISSEFQWLNRATDVLVRAGHICQRLHGYG